MQVLGSFFTNSYKNSVNPSKMRLIIIAILQHHKFLLLSLNQVIPASRFPHFLPSQFTTESLPAFHQKNILSSSYWLLISLLSHHLYKIAVICSSLPLPFKIATFPLEIMRDRGSGRRNEEQMIEREREWKSQTREERKRNRRRTPGTGLPLFKTLSFNLLSRLFIHLSVHSLRAYDSNINESTRTTFSFLFMLLNLRCTTNSIGS